MYQYVSNQGEYGTPQTGSEYSIPPLRSRAWNTGEDAPFWNGVSYRYAFYSINRQEWRLFARLYEGDGEGLPDITGIPTVIDMSNVQDVENLLKMK